MMMHRQTLPRLALGMVMVLITLAACGSKADGTPATAPVLAAQSNLTDDPSPPSAATVIAKEPQAAKAGSQPGDELIERGRILYQRQCAACHSLEHNRVGPRHRGIFGRQAGTVPGYRYSAALQGLELTWDRVTLDAWLENPPAIAPGTAMGFRMQRPEERAAIIAYLEAQ